MNLELFIKDTLHPKIISVKIKRNIINSIVHKGVKVPSNQLIKAVEKHVNAFIGPSFVTSLK